MESSEERGKMKSLRIVLAVLLIGAGAAQQSRAQDVILGIGGRVGATLDPDQVHFGVHADLGEIVEQLVFRPNVEVGVGNDLTLVAINPEVVYRSPTTGRRTTFHMPGAGSG